MIIPFPGKPGRQLTQAERLAQLHVLVGKALTGALAALTQEDYVRARELTLQAYNGIVELERNEPK